MIPKIFCTLVASWEDNLDMGTTFILPAVPQKDQVLVVDMKGSEGRPTLFVVTDVGYRGKREGSPGGTAYEPRVLLKAEQLKS